MIEKSIDATLDITGVVCPMTFVKAKVAIEELDKGQIIEIHLNEGEPLLNVPRSLKEDGHKVIDVQKSAQGTYLIRVEKSGLK
jgi:tRNA 2-thiouridine synthesizing protein A